MLYENTTSSLLLVYRNAQFFILISQTSQKISFFHQLRINTVRMKFEKLVPISKPKQNMEHETDP